MTRRRLPGTVLALGTVSLLTDLSSEMIYPLVPALLTTVLGAGAVALGLVEGLAETTAAAVKVLSGRRTDRSGRRKPLIVGGYGLSGLARPLIGLAGSWPVVAGLRFADRIGKGLRTSPRDALIVDTVGPEDRGRAYGLHRAMDHAGAVLGPLVAAALLTWFGFGIRQVIWAAAVPAVAVLVVLARWVREPRRTEPSDRPTPRPRLSDTSPAFRSLLLAVLVFTLGNSTDAFFLLRFGDLGLSASQVAMLWGAHGAVKMASTWVGGHLTDRMGRRPLVAAGWTVYAAVYVAFGSVSTVAPLVVTFLAYGLVFGLTEPAERAWVADLSEAGGRGSAFGWYHGAVGLAALPASILFGFLYEWRGPLPAFGAGAALALVATMLLTRVGGSVTPAVTNAS